MSTEYYDLKNNNTVPETAICDVCDECICDLKYCPLEELDSDDLFTCSNSCLYYNDINLKASE